MNISVKKFSKKSLSLLIALIMVFSALPLTPPISADAATSTIQMTAMGCFRNGTASRVGADYVSVCNDSQNTNFDIAVFNFDISSLSFKTYDEVSAMFNYYTRLTESENKGVSFYYPTAHLSEFEIVNNYQGQPNTSIWTGDDGKHLSRAISYYGLQPLQLGITTSSTKKTDNLDIGAAIKFAKLQGNSIATAVAVIASAGKSGSSGGWTDTRVGYSSKSVTVNITEVSAKEYVKQNIDNVKTSYPNISENNAGSFASNLVVADSWGSIAEKNFAVDKDKNNDDTIKVHGYSNAVAIYTGSNGVKFPVVLEKVANSDQNDKFDLYQQIEHVALENGASFSLGSTWEYCNSPTDFTSKTLTTTTGDYVQNISSDINTTLTTDQGVNDKKDINTAKNDKFATDLGKSFKNYIAYNGTGNTSLYYDKLSAPVFDYQADYAVYYAEGSWFTGYTWYITYKNGVNQNLSSNGNYYVINMKPLLDITKNSSFKENFLNVYNNESKYETASLNAYYQTMADIVAFDLTSRGLDTEQKIASVAKEIKDLVDSYKLPELNQCTVTFTRTNLVDFTKDDIIATVQIEPNTAFADNPNISMPALSKASYKSNNQHYEYFWQIEENYVAKGELTSSTIVDKDITVREVTRTVNCTYDENDATCMSKALCKVCREPVGNLKPHSYTKETFVDAVGDDNSYTKYTCTMCGREDETVKARKYTDQSSYWEIYRALRAQAKDKIAENAATNGTKYTSASINALENAIARVREEKVGDKTKSNIYIENENKILREATNELKLNQYSITVKYVDENGKELKVGKDGATSKTYPAVDYGTIQNIVAPTSYDGKEYIVYKWTRDIQGNNTISGLNSSSLGVVVKGEAQYYVYLKKASLDSAVDNNSAIVKLNNRSNKVMDVGCVVKGDQRVTITGNKITLTDLSTNPNSVTLTAPNYSFYTLSGFKINGKTVTNGSTVQIDSETVIKPEYTPINTITITVGSGVAGGNVSTSWDSRVKLTSTLTPTDSQLIKWTANINGADVVWGYGETLSFQATKSCTVRCELISKDMATPSVSVDYVSYNLYKANTITAVSRIAVPEGYTVVEYGTILKTSNNLNSTTPSLSAVESATYDKTNAGGVFKATQQITGTNQFAMNFFAATDYEKMYVGAVAYLVYKEANSNEECVIYSNTNGGKVVTSSYNKTAVGNN